MGTDIDGAENTGGDDRNSLIQDYEAVVESLQADLEECKEEQIRLRAEVESLRDENRVALQLARTFFSHFNTEDCPQNIDDKECLENLKKQMTILRLEKDSMLQLWQTSLQTVEALENEIKTSHSDITAQRYYEEQVNRVKETYSEAIKALESKLIQAKENFIIHQTLWESCRDRVESLNQEKLNLAQKIRHLENDILMKAETYKKVLDDMKTTLEDTKRELEVNKNAQRQLENELVEARCLATRMSTKDQESKTKVAEAISLVEIAMREKEMVMQREAAVLDEKSKLQSHLTNVAEEFAMKLERELAECRHTFDSNCKKFVLEIKELKSQLREKVTLLDRAQREIQMLEEEMGKRKHGSEEVLHRSHTKAIELEQKLRECEEKLMICEETDRRKFEEKIRLSESRVVELEDKLANVNDRLRRSQMFGSRELEERVREADERAKEAMDRYSGLEKRLMRALNERENMASELRSLQMTFDREVSRRENERQLLEGRVRELQEEVRSANDVARKAGARASQSSCQLEHLQRQLEERKGQMIDNNEDLEIAGDKSSIMSVLREKYEDRFAVMTKHVKIHQELSGRWKAEAESLTTKFENRSKELNSKIHSPEYLHQCEIHFNHFVSVMTVISDDDIEIGLSQSIAQCVVDVHTHDKKHLKMRRPRMQ